MSQIQHKMNLIMYFLSFPPPSLQFQRVLTSWYAFNSAGRALASINGLPPIPPPPRFPALANANLLN